MKWILFLIIVLVSSNVVSSASPASLTYTSAIANLSKDQKKLEELFAGSTKEKSSIIKLKRESLLLDKDAVVVLTSVMKNSKYPEASRWVATFMLGQIAGKSASPFLSKFLHHPEWLMKVAALKSLAALNEKRFASEMASLLSDPSFLVRFEALQTIQKLGLRSQAPYVWAMLYDQRNYQTSKAGSKRGDFIKTIIATIGVLKFEKAKDPLLTMMQKPRYADIHSEISMALEKITDKKAPSGSIAIKKQFWNKERMSTIQI